MKPHPAPTVSGNTEAERLDSATRKMFTVSKEEIERREATWKKSQSDKISFRRKAKATKTR